MAHPIPWISALTSDQARAEFDRHAAMRREAAEAMDMTELAHLDFVLNGLQRHISETAPAEP